MNLNFKEFLDHSIRKILMGFNFGIKFCMQFGLESRSNGGYWCKYLELVVYAGIFCGERVRGCLGHLLSFESVKSQFF